MLNKMEKITKYQSIVIGVIWFSFISNAVGDEYIKTKPEWLKSCKIFEPGFTKCSTESIQGLMTHLTNEGFPELTEKFGPLDPMKLDEVKFKEDNNQAVTITCNLKDLVAKGLSKMIIKESKVSRKDFSWETKILIPNLVLDGHYEMSGKILLIPLNGSGKIFIDLNGLNILMRTKTHLYEKGDFTFYNITNIGVDLKIDGLKTNLENIFNGNSKDVERSTNQFFNDNWPAFFEALKPIITETVQKILMNILGTSFHLLPANFIVEDIPKSTELYKNKS